MKTYFFVLIGMAFCFPAQSQVTIRKQAVVSSLQKSVQYDSMTNFVAQKNPVNYKQYIGYKLFYIPISSKFKITQKKDTTLEGFYTKKPVEVQKTGRPPFEKTLIYQARFASFTPEQIQGNQNLKAAYEESKAAYESRGKVKSDVYKPFFIPLVEQGGEIVGEVRTRKSDMEGKYFTILDIQIREHFGEPYCPLTEYGKEDLYLSAQLEVKLLSDASKDTLYWEVRVSFLDAKHYIMNDFLFMPYYTKQKELYENQTLVAGNSLSDLMELNTGETIEVSPGERWKCTEVSLLETPRFHLVPSYVLKNTAGQEIRIDLGDLERKGFVLEKVYLEKERQKKLAAAALAAENKKAEAQRAYQLQQFKETCLRKFGDKYGKLIIEGKVELGMTQEMCRMAWGAPIDINRTVVTGLVHEQWVYCGNNYLYFENGKLTAIQN